MWDIFGRLPTKSIGMLRCVSKRWFSLTTDPQFVAAYSVDMDSFFLCCEFTDPNSSMSSTEASLQLIPSSLRPSRGEAPPGITQVSSTPAMAFSCAAFTIITTCYMYAIPPPRSMSTSHIPMGLISPILLNFSLAFHPSTCPRFKIFSGECLIRNQTHDPFSFLSYIIYRFSSETWSWERILTLDRHPYQCYLHQLLLLNAYWEWVFMLDHRWVAPMLGREHRDYDPDVAAASVVSTRTYYGVCVRRHA